MAGKHPAATTTLSETMQRFIDLGLIDSWLRGLTDIVPYRHSFSETSPAEGAFNTHMIGYETAGAITPEQVINLRGFQKLVACAESRDIAFSCHNGTEGYLKITFHPDRPFSATRIFGKKPEKTQAETLITIAPAVKARHRVGLNG